MRVGVARTVDPQVEAEVYIVGALDIRNEVIQAVEWRGEDTGCVVVVPARVGSMGSGMLDTTSVSMVARNAASP